MMNRRYRHRRATADPMVLVFIGLVVLFALIVFVVSCCNNDNEDENTTIESYIEESASIPELFSD